jgi:hypothetical protein
MALFDAIGGLLGTDKTDEAIAAQKAGAAEAARIQQEMYNQSREDLAPWRQAGEKALTGMQDADYMRDFTMADYQADPGYQFRMDEANKALERSASARGMQLGGGQLKALSTLNQNLASQEYKGAYDRFNADRDRRFGRLSNLSTMGQNSASQQASTAMAHGQSMGNLYAGVGNAEGAAHIGQANLNAGMFNTMIEAGGKAAGSAGMAFCDRRLKTDIGDVSKSDMEEMKKVLKAFRFHYKSQEHGKGLNYGVMAQDLEKSKVGKTLVFEDAGGNKMVDIGKVMIMWLAAGAEE